MTVATGDLARVAIMSGVMRNTVCPFASVVMDEGGRRRTSFPWIRRFVAVIGIPVPPGLFIPNWPVMDTFNKSDMANKYSSCSNLTTYSQSQYSHFYKRDSIDDGAGCLVNTTVTPTILQ